MNTDLAVTAIQQVAPAADQGLTAGPGVSLSDVSRFDHAMYSASAQLDVTAVDPTSPVASAMAKPLDHINDQVTSLEQMASRMADAEGRMKPGDTFKFMAKSQVFMLECTLASNVATRASDGVSQLFKQQS